MYKVNEIKNTLYDSKISKKYAIKLERLKKGEKISIVADIMFKAMFQTLSEASDNVCYEKKNIMRSWTKEFFFYGLLYQFIFS